MAEHTFSISKISCGHCVATIQNELKTLAGVANINGDPLSKTIDVEWQDPANFDQIQAKLAEIGYPAD